jgi:hypothetical protein
MHEPAAMHGLSVMQGRFNRMNDFAIGREVGIHRPSS